MKISYVVIAALFGSLAFAACTASQQNSPIVSSGGKSTALRSLNSTEREADFDTLVKGIKNYYAPLSYKENRFGFKFDDLAKEYRALALDAKTDDAYAGIIKQFLSRFHDGHVSMEMKVNKNMQVSVPIVLTPVEGHAIVATIMDEAVGKENNIERGDEVLEIDGESAMSYLPKILKYESFAADLSNEHWIARALSRKTYMTELLPQKPTVNLKIAKPSGEVFERTLVWNTKNSDSYVDRQFVIKGEPQSYSRDSAEVAHISLDKMGDETPFFASEKLKKAFNVVNVVPSEEYLKKYGLTDMTKTPKLFAAMYRFNGKTLLFIRQATYSVTDAPERIAWFKAVMDQYGTVADVLVLDQTHNPGGSLFYAQDFVSLFAKTDSRNLVNFLHADRAWLTHMSEELDELKKNKEDTSPKKDLAELAYKLVESAYDNGLELTESPLSLARLNHFPKSDFTWTKPVLMLTDELAGSCGDIVPMLMKENKLATLFGERTMGLGGNVEPIVTLGNSQIVVHLTRGFFMTYRPDGKYDLTNPTENNGVTPDIHYSHTLSDFRNGYIDYVTAFSKAAADLATK